MKALVFYAVFFLMFVIGGFLNYFGILSYKMVLGASLPLLLLPFIRIRFNWLLLLSTIFLVVTLTSAAVNQTNLLLTLWFLQNCAFPVLMYIVVSAYLRADNIKRVINWVVLIAAIQLPIILFQRLAYPVLSRFAKVEVAHYDIGFGSFYTSDDPALSFFVLGTLLFLLIDDRHNYFVRNKTVLIIWLTLTILVLNSKIAYLILALVWAYYLITRVKRRITFYLVGFGTVILLIAYLSPLGEQFVTNVTLLKQQLEFSVAPDKAELFYETAQGNRPATVLHLARQRIKFIGEGPHALYNPLTNKFNKGGDTSQLITFYVELGVIGLLVSYAMLYSLTLGRRKSEFTRLYLVVLIVISAVSNIFLDASIMMIFAIFCSIDLVPDRNESTQTMNSPEMIDA